MNQRYGEHNGESQQEGRFGQTDRVREGYGRDEYRGAQRGSERYDERDMGREEGSRRYGREGYGRESYGREGYGGMRGGYGGYGAEGYGRGGGFGGQGQYGQGSYSEAGRYNEGRRGGQGYPGEWFGEGGGRDFERSAYQGAMGYRDQEPWRSEWDRPFFGRREEPIQRGMRTGYGGGWESIRGEARPGERGWESGRESGGSAGLLGKFFGRGPKGYKRSDERIREDICERLSRSGHLDSSEVTITVKEGEVTLSGTVPERWMRHEIENVADDCMGVKDIDNNIRVQRQTEETGTGSTSGARTGAGSSTTTSATKQ